MPTNGEILNRLATVGMGAASIAEACQSGKTPADSLPSLEMACKQWRDFVVQLKVN